MHTTGGTPIQLRFPGQWYQAESGLHQNWMRDYDPTTGRYMQADPLGLIDGASVYGYARQNPGRYVDPRGENTIAIGAGYGASAGPGGAFLGAVVGGVIAIGGYLLYDVLTDDEDCDNRTDCSKASGLNLSVLAFLIRTRSKVSTSRVRFRDGTYVLAGMERLYSVASANAGALDHHK